MGKGREVHRRLRDQLRLGENEHIGAILESPTVRQILVLIDAQVDGVVVHADLGLVPQTGAADMGREAGVERVLLGRPAGRIVDNQVQMRLNRRTRAPKERGAEGQHAEEVGVGRLVEDAARVARQLTA